MKKIIINILAILVLFACNTFLVAQFQNFRIYPSGNSQIEPSIVKHPLNPMILLASAYTITGAFRSEGVYVSTDGGSTWRGKDTINTGSSTNNHAGDPGPVIDKDGNFIITHQGAFISGMFSNTSTDMGLTWTGNYQIASGDQDKGTPATDDNQSSQYYGRTYLAWTRFTSPFPIVVSYTANSGLSWTAFTQVNNTPGGFLSQGADVKTGVNGEVFVCWAGILQAVPQNEKFCGLGKSTDGGNSWVTNENIFNMNGVKTASLSPWNIRINGYPRIDIDKSGGLRNGWIYIVTGEKDLAPAGTDPDIVFHRSTDGGNSWSQGIRVNQDPLNNGKFQYFPAITVDEEGGINIVYYDNREETADSMDVFLSRSTDGGSSWHDIKINDHKFRPKTVSGSGGAGNQGDNIGIISSIKRLVPVWMDNSTGNYQVWFTVIDLNQIGVDPADQNVPQAFVLKQNYPNPFNPSTVIEYELHRALNVELKIFDVKGNEVLVLLNAHQNAGNYKFILDTGKTKLASGIYFYRLKTDSDLQTKMFVYLK